MASNIEIVDLSNFEKIQNFLNDSAYKEILENSENFNTRLCIERRLRMPFLETQTGVAQTHCALFMKKKQRMPGFRDGQIYTYPSTRWRKPKRQYLLNHHHSYRAYQYREPTHHHPSVTSGSSSIRDHFQTENAAIVASDGNSLGAGGDNNDSKDSHANAEKEWFHEDMHMSHYHHAEDFDEDFESDNDFDESYSSRGKRKRGSRSARKSNTVLEGTPKRGRKGGGSRRRAGGGDGESGDRRRRGGAAANAVVVAGTVSGSAGTVGSGGGGNNTASVLAASTLEASHSNSVSPIATNDETSQSASAPIGSSVVAANFDKTSNDGSIPSNEAGSALNSNANNNGNGNSSGSGNNSSSFPAAAAATVAAASHKKEGGGSGSGGGGSGAKNKARNADREVAQPSPYCDFCLGDQRENKKTNLPEELVSCSDCGRSGHPSCLQFTQNMIISVKRYRWQCIECKYCSICGTSDNDDQLLFCDDCDRGYHMYCLSPPLITPPEGSWSCKLCIDEFHGEPN